VPRSERSHLPALPSGNAGLTPVQTLVLQISPNVAATPQTHVSASYVRPSVGRLSFFPFYHVISMNFGGLRLRRQHDTRRRRQWRERSATTVPRHAEAPQTGQDACRSQAHVDPSGPILRHSAGGTQKSLLRCEPVAGAACSGIAFSPIVFRARGREPGTCLAP